MADGPGTPPLLRVLNDRAVLGAVLDGNQLTIADLVARTGLSKPTVGQSVRRLVAGELLRHTGSVPGRSGPAAAGFGAGPGLGTAVGMEIRAGRLSAVALDPSGVESARLVRHQVTENGAPAQILGALAALGVVGRISALAVGVPGTYDRAADRIRYADRLTGWMGEGLVEEIRLRLPDVVVEIENDAKLVAVAEQTVGVGRDCACLALLYSGSGLASAAVVDGVLHRGANGAAGEIGYLTGVAGPGTVQDRLGPKAVLALGRDHDLHHTVASELVAEAAGARTPGAVAVLDELARRYAGVASMIVATIDPQRLVLTGPLLQAGGEPLRQRISDLVRTDLKRRVDLAVADVADPVLTGAVLRAVAGRRLRALEAVKELTTETADEKAVEPAAEK